MTYSRPASLLDAMEGIAYIVTLDEKFADVGGTAWRAFAEANGAPGLADPESIRGLSLDDIIQGKSVKATYRGFLNTLTSGERRQVAFIYRCDSPAFRRELRMSISTVCEDARLSGFLFQSVLLSESERPPVTLFDAEHLMARIRAQAHLPILVMCSFCQKVCPGGPDLPSHWMEAEAYYRAGGASDVRISHGVCDDCHDTFEAYLNA